MDPVTLVNLILTIAVLIMGIWAYVAVKSRSMLYVGTGFGLFALTHLLTLMGLAASMAMFILIVRILAYLLILYAVYIVIAKKKNA
jgi:uncharacterized membrane protein YhfC